MASSGPNSGGTFANEASVGTVDWNNPTRAVASDDSKATCYVGLAAVTTHYLKATNFGFAIPVGATIVGILVEFEKGRADEFLPKDYSVRIVKDGTIQGDEKADTVTSWPASDTYVSHGGAADLWGLSWTLDDINDSTFGVVIAASLASWATARIDHLRITVYYTPSVLNFNKVKGISIGSISKINGVLLTDIAKINGV